MPGLTWNSASRSHTGCKRKTNEDSVFSDEGLRLLCVADGMGGHSRGDAASQLVAYTLSRVDASGSLPGTVDEIDSGLQSAHRLLIERGANEGKIIGVDRGRRHGGR